METVTESEITYAYKSEPGTEQISKLEIDQKQNKIGVPGRSLTALYVFVYYKKGRAFTSLTTSNIVYYYILYSLYI